MILLIAVEKAFEKLNNHCDKHSQHTKIKGIFLNLIK